MSPEREVLKVLIENYLKTLDLLETIIKASRSVVERVQATIEKEGEADAGTS